MATANGKYVVWGVAGITATGFVSSGTEPISSGNSELQSVSVSNQSDVTEIKNGAGDVSIMVYSNHNRECSIEVVPSAATLNGVQGYIENLLPAPGTIITLVESDEHLTTLDGNTATNNTDGATDGKWSYVSGELTRSNDAEARISMTLKQYAGCDLDVAAAI
jgi:hypothetical protein